MVGGWGADRDKGEEGGRLMGRGGAGDDHLTPVFVSCLGFVVHSA